MKRCFRFLKFLVYALALNFITLNCAHAVDETLLLATQNMLANGQSVEALDLLKPQEEEYAGNKEFDYLLGLALLDTGDAASSVFAFQRVLAIDSNFAGARIELGRAYFDMGQYQRAQREFLLVKNQSPPQNVINVIDKYIVAIESQNLRNRQGWKGFLQLGLGNDTNVNNATSLDDFLGFSLSENSRETSSTVITTLGGASYDLPLSVDKKLFFKGSVNHRANNEASFTSTINYDLLAGYDMSFNNAGNLSLALQLYTADVDGDSNNKGVNVTGQYRIPFSASNQLGLFVRIGSIDYVKEFEVKDVDQNVFGLSWSHVFTGDTRISLVTSMIAGEDTALITDSPYGRDYLGFRLSASYPVTHRLNIFASMGSNSSDYSGTFFESSENRTDELTDFTIGSSWRINKTWVLRGVIGHTQNESNIDIFDYDKNIIMFTARSEFLP